MGPPPRSFAADAQGCIMVRVLRTHRIQGCGTINSCANADSPPIVIPTRPKPAVVLEAVKAKPSGWPP